MKKLLYVLLPLILFAYEPDYAFRCDTKDESDSCIKAAIKHRHSTTLHIEYLEKSCNLGNKDGCYALSKAYIDYQQNTKKSGECYLKACNMGHAQACFDIGVMASNLGREFQKNMYLDKSCELGYSKACDMLHKH